MEPAIQFVIRSFVILMAWIVEDVSLNPIQKFATKTPSVLWLTSRFPLCSVTAKVDFMEMASLA